MFDKDRGSEQQFAEKGMFSKSMIRFKNTHLRSAANPAPTPLFFVGVLTLTKIRSASRMALSTSVEKTLISIDLTATPTIGAPNCVRHSRAPANRRRTRC